MHRFDDGTLGRCRVVGPGVGLLWHGHEVLAGVGMSCGHAVIRFVGGLGFPAAWIPTGRR